ncbi:MAG: hypothetical protein RLZZ628_3047, partial [Bacteroidota bacterium]
IYHNVKKAFSQKHLSNLLIINELDRCYRHQIKKEINDLAAELFKMSVTVQLTPFQNVTKAA